MNIAILLEKISDIERSIGSETDRAILEKVLDAHDCALQMQKEMIETLRKVPKRDFLQRYTSSGSAA